MFYAHAQTAIYSGTGFGTYYYNIGQTNACGSDFAAQNEGFVECSPLAALSLNQINSEYLVAMNHSQLVGNMAKYCGKSVIVSVDGVPSSLPLFIGDGCKRCRAGSSSHMGSKRCSGVDFSYSALSDLSANACTDGHISISWKIMDETLYDFYTDETGSLRGNGCWKRQKPDCSCSNKYPKCHPRTTSYAMSHGLVRSLTVSLAHT